MLPGTLVGDRFVVDRKVGAGGMGTVYLGFDRVFGVPVALKVQSGRDAIDVERFEREAAILAALDHPGIVRYVAHGAAASGEHWIAMEWLDGEDLARRLARGGVSRTEGLALARRAAEALAFAHARGLVHRDIKPSNLFLPGGEVERVTLVDFGIARTADDARRLTGTGMILGTLGYVAPEQIQGAGGVDPRTDVFSLGCVLFECLTHRQAFEGAHPMAVLAKIVLQGPPSLRREAPDLPDALDDLLRRMLAKDPAERPAHAGEVAEALARVAFAPEGDAPPSARGARGSFPTLPPPSLPQAPPSLGLDERRLVSVVLAGRLDRAPEPAGEALRASEVARLVEPYGGKVALHAGQHLLVTVWSRGDAVDRAERAARCALALHGRAPELPICVVSGRGHLSSQVVSGALIDRGVRALGAARGGVMRLDEATAAALSHRFEVGDDGEGPVLRSARAEPDLGSRLLLGRPAPCVGRDRELAILDAFFDASMAEPFAGAVLVVGPAGTGKSRLAGSFIERLARRDAPPLVLVGRGDALDARSPFGMIADALRRAAGIRDGEPLGARRTKLASRLGRRLSPPAAARVTAFLGELTSTPFPDDVCSALRAARGDAMLMGDAMRVAWEDWLAAECAAQPVLLVLEDLHWGDAATVRLVGETLRNLREQPLVVLALARPDVHTRFPRLWADRELHTLALGPLSRRASERLVRDALGEGAQPAMVARIIEHGGGNPFYLQELVRAVAAGRGDALPASVLEAVEARLDAEGTIAKRALRAASVFGQRFSRDGVAALTGADPDLAGGWLAELAAHELIAPASSPAPAGDADYVFRHALVREAAYAALTDADRALGHELAGDWLERTGHTDAPAMAEHFERGGQPGRAVRWCQRGAEQALEASDLAAAIERADRGIACGAASAEERGALRLIQAEAHVWRGELALAVERGHEATELLGPGSPAWFRAVTQVVTAAGKLGDFARVEAWVGPATSAPPDGSAAGARIVCLGFCAVYLIFGGRVGAADRLIDLTERALRGPVALDPQPRAIAHQARGFRASAEGDLGGCLEALEAALAGFDQAGDLRNACTTRSNLGFVYAELGDFERAEEALRATLAGADRMGLYDLEAAVLHNLGHVLAYRGRLDEARLLEQRAVETFRRQGDPRLSGVGHVYLAKIALFAGDLAAAEREARAAMETPGAAGSLRSFAGAVLARALLAQGRPAEALAVAREAHAELTRLGALEEGESLVRLVHAEALRAAGSAEELERALAVARDRLLARAARIKDAAWRRRFLADVPDNAATLAAASQASCRRYGR